MYHSLTDKMIYTIHHHTYQKCLRYLPKVGRQRLLIQSHYNVIYLVSGILTLTF